MALGLLQDWSLAASGCAIRSFFVRFLYMSKALLMISWKLEDELEDEEAMMKDTRRKARANDFVRRRVSGWFMIGQGGTRGKVPLAQHCLWNNM